MLLEKIIIKKFEKINILKEELIFRSGEDKIETIEKIKDAIEDIDIVINSYIECRGKEFTKGELSKYNGKGDNLAYIAIEGTIYDVTGICDFNKIKCCNIEAGKDVTREYYSCDDDIKYKLKSGRIVGYLFE